MVPGSTMAMLEACPVAAAVVSPASVVASGVVPGAQAFNKMLVAAVAAPYPRNRRRLKWFAIGQVWVVGLKLRVIFMTLDEASAKIQRPNLLNPTTFVQIAGPCW